MKKYKSKSIFYCLSNKTVFWGCFATKQTNWFLLLVILINNFLFIMTNGIFFVWYASQWKTCLFLNFRHFCLHCGSQVSSTRRLRLCVFCFHSVLRQKYFSLQFTSKNKQGRMFTMTSWQLFTFWKSCSFCWKNFSRKQNSPVTLAGTTSLIIEISF